MKYRSRRGDNRELSNDCRKLISKGGISDIKLVKKAVMLKNGTEYRMQ